MDYMAESFVKKVVNNPTLFTSEDAASRMVRDFAVRSLMWLDGIVPTVNDNEIRAALDDILSVIPDTFKDTASKAFENPDDE